MEHRAHPVLIGPSSLSHNRFYDEVFASHYWGLEPDEWAWKSREARAVMTAFALVAPVVKEIGSYDSAQFVKHNRHLFE